MPNLKILFTQDALVNAGAERSHLEILSRFSDNLDVSMVYFYPKHESAVRDLQFRTPILGFKIPKKIPQVQFGIAMD